MAISRSGI